MNTTTSPINLLNIDLGPTKDALAMATLIPLVIYSILITPIVYYLTKYCIKNKSSNKRKQEISSNSSIETRTLLQK
jgi:hypothetical protein